METQNPVMAELQILYRTNPPKPPTQEEIEARRISFETMVNRVMRREGIFLPTECRNQITTLPCQAGLDCFMINGTTQINTYELGGYR